MSELASLTTSWWDAVRTMSPRPRVKVADVDERGQAINSYRTTMPLAHGQPRLPSGAPAPFAVYLADRRLQFKLLAFDLDVSRGPVGPDLARLCSWLDAIGIDYVVAASGPGGGRHVWVAITGRGAPAELVAELARALVARGLPTLDRAPLCNPRQGCVRPPGAPHRLGAVSKLLHGDLSVLTAPTTELGQLEQLLALVGPPAPASPAIGRPTARATRVDDAGHRHLPGPRRALPAASAAAAQTLISPGQDASPVAWTVLLGAVRSRLRCEDVAALRDAGAPGLEHLRTQRADGGSPPSKTVRRVARSTEQAAQLLSYQWERAVDHVARSMPTDISRSGEHTTEGDAEFASRAAAVVTAVIEAQTRAEACRGRWWDQRAGASDRLVLDLVCLKMLRTWRLEVALDIRSIALETGLGRETARTALRRLTDGFLEQAAPAAGPLAAIWTLPSLTAAKTATTDFSTPGLEPARSHEVPPPPAPPSLPPPAPGLAVGTALELQIAWVARLEEGLSLRRHDCWTGRPGGLGHRLGALYAVVVVSGTTSVDALAAQTGRSSLRVARSLRILHVHRLVAPWSGSEPRRSSPGARRQRSGPPYTVKQDLSARWRATSSGRRTTAARLLGVHGTLAQRARIIASDREAWAWWQAELSWMHTPAPQRPERRLRRRRPGPGQQTLVLPADTARHRHGPYPRRTDGRADHQLARVLMRLPYLAGGSPAGRHTALTGHTGAT